MLCVYYRLGLPDLAGISQYEDEQSDLAGISQYDDYLWGRRVYISYDSWLI